MPKKRFIPVIQYRVPPVMQDAAKPILMDQQTGKLWSVEVR